KEKNARLDRDVTLNIIDPTGGTGAARFTTSTDADGNRYVMLRYRPPLAVQARRQQRDWVFLFESSGDRDPLLARAQLEVIRTLLANAEHGDRFMIVSASTRVNFPPRYENFSGTEKDLREGRNKFGSAPLLMAVDAANVHSAIRFLEESHLIGALDLDQAL